MKEKIICITTPTDRTYYQATAVAKEFLDRERNVVNVTGTLPDGKIEEYTVSSVTHKTFSNGQLHGELEIIDLETAGVTLKEKYNRGALVKVSPNQNVRIVTEKDESDNDSSAAIPVISGTILKSNKGTHSFYLNGEEVAEETVSSSGTTIELLGNIPDGEVKELDENNKIKAIAYYKNNKLNGPLVRYDEDGEVLSREEYVAGILQGPAEYFSYLKDNLFSTKCTYTNALLEGERTVVQKDGTIRETSHYQQGKRQGERTCFFNNGVPELKENYEKGKLEGERTLFFPSGKIWFKEHFVNDFLEGERLGYYPWGQLYLEESYAKGVLHGVRKVYGQNGDLLLQEEYQWGTIVHDTEHNIK